MKKKSIKKLELKKVTVIKFETMKNIKGGTIATEGTVVAMDPVCPVPELSYGGTQGGN